MSHPIAAINARTTTRTATRTPAQIAALAFGVVYLLVGLAGWANPPSRDDPSNLPTNIDRLLALLAASH